MGSSSAPWDLSTFTPANLSNFTEVDPFLPDGLYFHPHWQLYREFLEGIPDLVHYALGIYIAIVCMVGILGNLLVIYIFTSTRSLRSPSNMFIINLAISDLGFSAINGFPLMTISCFQRAWYFGGLACQLYAMLGGLFGFNSIASLACISMDRYYVIAKPLEAMRKATKKRALTQIIICWAWSALWSVPPLFGWGAYIPEGFQTECSFDYLSRDWNNFSFNLCIFFLGFVAPVCIIAYCYINIISAVTGQAKEMAKTAERMGAKATNDDKVKKQEIALAKVAAGTISLFLMSWLPYAFVAQAGVWGFTTIVNPYTCVAPVMFAKASAMWNPIVYALSHPRFRAQLDARFPWLLCCKGRNVDKDDGKSEASHTQATTVEMKGKREKEEDQSSVCTEMSESGYTTDGGGSNQGNAVDINPNPGKTAPEPKTHAPEPPAHTQSQTNGAAATETKQDSHKTGAVGSTEPPRKKRMSSRARGSTRGKQLGLRAAEAFKGVVDAYMGLQKVKNKLGRTEEKNELAEEQNYENPAYSADGNVEEGEVKPDDLPPPPPDVESSVATTSGTGVEGSDAKTPSVTVVNENNGTEDKSVAKPVSHNDQNIIAGSDTKPESVAINIDSEGPKTCTSSVSDDISNKADNTTTEKTPTLSDAQNEAQKPLPPPPPQLLTETHTNDETKTSTDVKSECSSNDTSPQPPTSDSIDTSPQCTERQQSVSSSETNAVKTDEKIPSNEAINSNTNVATQKADEGSIKKQESVKFDDGYV